MPIIESFNHLLSIDSSGIIRYSDSDVIKDLIDEWFETPAGTVADFPSWGHNLNSFRFEPPSVSLDVMLEMTVLKKMQADIGLWIRSIRAKFTEIDRCDISINFGFMIYEGTISL